MIKMNHNCPDSHPAIQQITQYSITTRRAAHSAQPTLCNHALTPHAPHNSEPREGAETVVPLPNLYEKRDGSFETVTVVDP